MAINRGIVIAGCIAAGLLSLLYFFFDPSVTKYFPPCPFFVLTGFYCPGCGSQRAMHDLLHADVLAAFGHNVLFVCFLPFVLFSGVAFTNNAFNSRKIGQKLFYSNWFPWTVFGAVVLFWICRNIPVSPFTYLAP